MMIFLIRLVLGAFAFNGHAAATDNVSEYSNSLPFVINPNGVACLDEFYITSAKLCVVAAKRIKITKMKINVSSKFQPPYGCSLRGKTVFFSRDKNAEPPQKSVTPICRILSDCCTCDPDPSTNPSKRLSAEPSVEPSIFSTTLHPSKSVEPSLMHTVDPSSTFTFIGSKKIEKTLNSEYYDGIIKQPHTDYILRFTVKPQGKSSVFSSIIHMTTGGVCKDYGTCVPAVFFKPKTTSLYVVAGQNAKGNLALSSFKQLAINTESDIEIRVVGTSFTLLINRVEDYTRSIGDRSPLSNVKVYFGGPWYYAANAIISNVTFIPV